MQWVSNRNTLLCLLLLSWVINYCALVSFNPCPDEKRNVQPSFSPRLMFRLAPSFEGFVASLKNLQYNFPKMRGGGQRLFGTFSKTHPFWWRHPFLTLENKIASWHHQIRSHSGDKRCFPSWISFVICVTNGNPLTLLLVYTPILLPYLRWSNLYVILLVSWFWIGIHGSATATSDPSENGSPFRWRSKH